MDNGAEAFWTHVETELAGVRAFCLRLAGNREDAEDLCQDALVTAYLNFAALRSESNFRGWLYRIVINTFKNRVRRRWWQRFPTLSRELEERLQGRDPAAVYDSRRILQRAFQAVSPEERALITLADMEGWTISELARVLGRSEEAVKVKLHRIRRKMRDALVRFFARAERQQACGVAVAKEQICIVTKPNSD